MFQSCRGGPGLGDTDLGNESRLNETKGVDILREGLGMGEWLTLALNIVCTFQTPGEFLSRLQVWAGVKGVFVCLTLPVTPTGQLEPSPRFRGGGGESSFSFHAHSYFETLSFPQPRRRSPPCLLVLSWLIGPNPGLTAPSGSLQLNTEAGELSRGTGEAEAAISG